MPGHQPTVYLHVGIAKTGTTYLQELLWQNRALLDRLGVRYPGDFAADHFRASVDLRQTPFAGEHTTYVPGSWDALAATAASAPDRAVISHETLTRTRVEQIRRAASSFRDAELHVVVTVRDLGRQLPAVWQEQVKNRSTSTYEQFLTDVADRPHSRRHKHFWEAQDVLAVLQRWSAAVPPSRTHVVTVPQPGGASGLLWERFASVIGVDPGVVDTDVPLSNVSLGVAEAEVLRRLNGPLRKRLDWPTYERQVKVGLTERLAAASGSARLGVPGERRPWVRETAAEFVDGLRAGGYDVVGDLAELMPVFDDRPVQMPADVPSGRLWQIAGGVVADLLAERSGAPAGERLRRTALRPRGLSGRVLRRVRRLSG